MPTGLFLWIPSLLCAVHVVRTRQQMYWLWILVIGGPLGAAVYGVAIILPELLGGRTARGLGKAAQRALDPEREYRRALAAYDDTPTIGNRMKVAQALAALGRWTESESHWDQCVTGHWAEDPAILLGHTHALLELGQFAKALERLQQLKALGREGEAPQVTLAFARAYEGLGRNQDAEAPYRAAADRVPGLEAGARYVAFMAKTGRKGDAEIGLAELDRRLKKIAPPLRAEARIWRDLAAQAVANVKA